MEKFAVSSMQYRNGVIFVFTTLVEQYGKEQIEMISPLVLAFIGDTVYDLYIRTNLVSGSNAGVDKLHKQATTYVKCSAQSCSFQKIEPYLTEHEIAIFKRGRNAKSQVPKNAEMKDYKNATGLEALIGYIFLSGDEKRLDEVMNKIWSESE